MPISITLCNLSKCNAINANIVVTSLRIYNTCDCHICFHNFTPRIKFKSEKIMICDVGFQEVIKMVMKVENDGPLLESSETKDNILSKQILFGWVSRHL